MASKKARPVLYRRKRQSKTNYKKRLRLLLSEKPRLVVRISGTRIVAQIIEFDPVGDKVIAGYDSTKLRALGWNYSLKNIPSAYLTGFAIAKSAASKVKGDVILDTGLRTPQKRGKLYSFLKGAIDGGLSVKFGSEEIFPSEEKLSGKDIEDYAKMLKEKDSKLFEQLFSLSLKNKADPTKMVSVFEKIKGSI